MKPLRSLEPDLKKLLTAFMGVLICGVTAGLILVALTTRASVPGMVERFNGSPVTSPSEIPETYPKPIMELLITTHSHVITFAFIFAAVGLLFYGTGMPPRWKKFWILEPFGSIITTFSGMWLMRFVHPGFSYLVLVSSALLYSSFYFMSFVIVRELISSAEISS